MWNDLIEVEEEAQAQWVMDIQQRGASSLVKWLKWMGTYGASAPLNSLEHSSHSALIYLGIYVDQEKKSACCSLWGLVKVRGGGSLRRKRRDLFGFWRQTFLSTIQTLENLKGDTGFDYFLCNFLHRVSILGRVNFRLLFSSPHTFRNGVLNALSLVRV